MGSSDEGKSSKPEKSSPPATEQNSVHMYPDWAAMQAYYGHRVALPPYFNSAVAPGHPPPPYMWGPPQPMVPPYGAPYAAIYAPGGVYAHPAAIPLGSQAHAQGVVTAAVSEPLVATPLSMDTPAKSSENADKSLIKKLKGFDGLAMSIGNANAEKTEGDVENKLSQSAETEGSSNGSDGNTEEDDKKCNRKRSREGTPTSVEVEKTETKAVLSPADKVLGVPVTPASAAAGQVVGTVVSPAVATTLELRNPGVSVKVSSPTVSPPNGLVSSEAWLQPLQAQQPVQNERELKRERRKQSNRESARRSRLRKQAETEELARRVETLNAENLALKSEINQLAENSQKLRLENAALTGKLKNLQSAQGEENDLATIDAKRNPSDSTENLLSRVNNSSSVGRSSDEGADMFGKNAKSGAKFHQLLDNRRADAVAAG
ncbi:common plant regulatory factor 1-like [Chenopodium quinoa]|uniref:BZIP domain-containing protein n=1 Tax=Chenopodium quinoa TaxID=63459 RepID=A0A803KZI3_CHEQI|nr:common plant regulatory factor 1-like [Chenopodium quinoa]XP_021748042.1 common plant regulatory factor 1-like [Chenopodium quinoa]